MGKLVDTCEKEGVGDTTKPSKASISERDVESYADLANDLETDLGV
jgi:hypothetical protein